jgi:hypothetical protein
MTKPPFYAVSDGYSSKETKTNLKLYGIKLGAV